MKFFSWKMIIGLLAAGAILLVLSRGAQADSDAGTVTICHATSSATNPYVLETPNKSGDVDGHDKHNGGIWFAGVSSWGDIIPPFSFSYCADPGYHLNGTICSKQNHPDKPVSVGTYVGKNWDSEGQGIWNNKCAIPALDCDGDYDGASPNDDDSCITPTVTPTPTLDCDGDTDGSNPNDDDTCVTPTVSPVSPTPTDTPTPTPTVSPTQTPSNPGGPGDGLSDGRSDGLSSCPQCTQAPSSSAPVQAVLGASTMAGTGTFETNLMMSLFALGASLLGAGYLRYKKERNS